MSAIAMPAKKTKKKAPAPGATLPTSFRLSPDALATIKGTQAGLGLKSEAAAVNVVFHQLRRELERCDATPPLSGDDLRVIGLVLDEQVLGTLGVNASLSSALGILLVGGSDRLAAAGIAADRAAAVAARVVALRPMEAVWAIGKANSA